jgi:hypothetical protein
MGHCTQAFLINHRVLQPEYSHPSSHPISLSWENHLSSLVKPHSYAKIQGLLNRVISKTHFFGHGFWILNMHLLPGISEIILRLSHQPERTITLQLDGTLI